MATRVGAVPEVIQDGQNGFLVEPRNTQQLANKLEQLINNEQLRSDLGTQAQKTVSEKFSLNKMVGEIEGLL